MKQKRYLRTIVCLVLGAVLLTGSAFANYENASGYTKLKSGILNMMTVENFSADAKLTLTYDGAELDSQQLEYKYDRNGSTSEYSKSLNSYGSNEQWTQDGFGISHYNDSYSVYSAYNKGFNDGYLNGTEEDKKMTDDMINFAELLCDTLVGDLKNNFVLVSTDGGTSTYQIDLSREQIPELVQSGLSLMFSSSSYDGYVAYESYDNMDLTDEEHEALNSEASELLEEHDYTGVVCIMEDGTIKHYATEGEYYDAIGYADATDFESLYYLLDRDPSISGISCTVSLDSEGRLSDVKASAILTGKDEGGNERSLTLDLDLSIYDYGTTSIEAFDKSLLNFNWDTTDDEYHYYQFDAEGNIIEYDNYQYDEYGNLINDDENINVEVSGPEATDEGAAADSPEEADADTDGGVTE